MKETVRQARCRELGAVISKRNELVGPPVNPLVPLLMKIRLKR